MIMENDVIKKSNMNQFLPARCKEDRTKAKYATPIAIVHLFQSLECLLSSNAEMRVITTE